MYNYIFLRFIKYMYTDIFLGIHQIYAAEEANVHVGNVFVERRFVINTPIKALVTKINYPFLSPCTKRNEPTSYYLPNFGSVFSREKTRHVFSQNVQEWDYFPTLKSTI